MTGFDSKRQASKDLLQPAMPNTWRDAVDNELICLHLGTVDSFPDARAALNALIDWHVATALDPEVSSDAQALIDRGAAAPVPAVQSAARSIAAEQAEDAGLWFVAETVSEAHLQAALRRLTTAVEGEEPVAMTPLPDAQIWMLATSCTIGGDWHIDKFARAIEAAHGIKGATT